MSKKPQKRMRKARERAELEAAAAERERIAETVSSDEVERAQVRGSIVFGAARRAFGYVFIALTAALLMTLSVSVGRSVLAGQAGNGIVDSVDSVLWSVSIGAGAMGGMFAFAPHMSRAVKSLFDTLLRRSAGRLAREGREAVDGPAPEGARRLRSLGRALARTAGALAAAILTAAAAVAAESLLLIASLNLTYSALGSALSGSWDVMLFMSAVSGISAGGPIAALPHIWRALMRLGSLILAIPAKARARRARKSKDGGADPEGKAVVEPGAAA